MSLSTLKKKYIDFKLVLLLAGFYLLFDLVLLVKVAYMRTYMKAPEGVENFSWSEFLVHNLLFDYKSFLNNPDH